MIEAKDLKGKKILGVFIETEPNDDETTFLIVDTCGEFGHSERKVAVDNEIIERIIVSLDPGDLLLIVFDEVESLSWPKAKKIFKYGSPEEIYGE